MINKFVELIYYFNEEIVKICIQQYFSPTQWL